MTAGGAGAPLSEANLLALTGEEALEDIKEITLRNHKLHSFDQGETARLINLQVMSLSHNLLSSLTGFQHLKHLISLNLNFNALTTLEGISGCTALQHLFVANNRVRDVSPLVPCTNLQTLHLFRNTVANLDITMVVLVSLPKLRELELAGNPCALAPEYKHRAVLQLELQSLDGDAVTQLDYDLAHEFFAANGGMPLGLGPRVDILTLEEVDGTPGASIAPAAACPAPGPSSSAAPRSTSEDGGAVPASQSRDGTGAVFAAPTSDSAAVAGLCAAPGPGPESHRHGSAVDANGRPSTSAWGPGRPSTVAAATCALPAGPGPGTNAAASAPQGPLLPRPGTAARRPGSATDASSGTAASARPGSAYSGLQSSTQLLSNEILNDHPLIIEYLAKHVLMEGLALAEHHGGPGRPGSGGSNGGGGGGARGPSFAQRLRDTAATMNACEDVDPRALAGQQQELIATPVTVRRGMAEEMVASATPNELCRQLVRLCEVLIKEVEACRAGRPASGSGCAARPGTAAGLRPMTAAGLRPTTSAGLRSNSSGGPSSSSSVLTPAEVGELVQLRVDVERLCRENKALRLENENMYWLVEEVKRLKSELASVSSSER